ncbi:hypothetical protein BO78DRAFT_116658 [Aspergillus sclerotiicarbonarius CBS 121057]|uniref:Uncharacterized protein n=1 Tax=Aspergillus sclerotiicarbonarius (strain CBS 121057 / IBT 28362) TaxID=1448318 RepID=A0A319E827_ASPSB|nr:hypothetical protein BO78DRAFT_116658 [Aspergillus sclerotiicarbonarius CBS 121057]
MRGCSGTPSTQVTFDTLFGIHGTLGYIYFVTSIWPMELLGLCYLSTVWLWTTLAALGAMPSMACLHFYERKYLVLEPDWLAAHLVSIPHYIGIGIATGCCQPLNNMCPV